MYSRTELKLVKDKKRQQQHTFIYSLKLSIKLLLVIIKLTFIKLIIKLTLRKNLSLYMHTNYLKFFFKDLTMP